jgi:hypothetical protein
MIHQQLRGYKVEEKLHLGIREQTRLNTTVLDHRLTDGGEVVSFLHQPRIEIFLCSTCMGLSLIPPSQLTQALRLLVRIRVALVIRIPLRSAVPRSRSSSLGRVKNFHFSIPSRPALG